MPVTILAYSLSQCVLLSIVTRFRRQGKMSSRFLNADRRRGDRRDAGLSADSSAQITFPWERSPQGSRRPAQSDDADLEMRIQRLENQLRQLTGQNEELQYRNRQLEERLRQLGGAPPRARRPAPGGPAPRRSPASAAVPPPVQRNPQAYPHRRRQPGYPQAQPGYDQQPQIAAPAPIVQEPAAPQARRPPSRRCLRPQPESQRPRRAARARRRPVADRQ